jgi:hypothetical protein
MQTTLLPTELFHMRLNFGELKCWENGLVAQWMILMTIVDQSACSSNPSKQKLLTTIPYAA